MKPARSIDTASGKVNATRWHLTDQILPAEDALIWADGRYMIATLVEGVSAGKEWHAFMDPRTDELLPWPTHWMPLPKAPKF